MRHISVPQSPHWCFPCIPVVTPCRRRSATVFSRPLHRWCEGRARRPVAAWPRRLTGTDATQTRFGPLVRRDGDANMRAAARYPARWSVLSCSRRAFSMGLRRGLLHCGETRRQQPTCRPFFASPLHRPARRAKLQPPRFIRAAIRFPKPKLGGWLPANVGRHLFHGLTQPPRQPDCDSVRITSAGRNRPQGRITAWRQWGGPSRHAGLGFRRPALVWPRNPQIRHNHLDSRAQRPGGPNQSISPHNERPQRATSTWSISSPCSG
jgi:hypothetical protein